MLLSVVLCAVSMSDLFQGELIFEPNSFHNHGSSIVETADGDLIAAWFHGSGERQSDDVLIQGARRRKGASEWSEPFVMADTPDLPDCNPVLFIDSRGVLWLFWIAVQDNMWGGSLLKYRTSSKYADDGPPEWEWQDVIHTRPVDLEECFVKVVDEGVEVYGNVLKSVVPDMLEKVDEVRQVARDKLNRRLGWMTRVPPIMLADGRLMLGLYSDVFNCSLAAFTGDWGRTWTFSTPIMDPDVTMLGNIQPAFAQRADGSILAFMRDNGLPKQVRVSVSEDNGHTWGNMLLSGISNPGSSVDVEVLRNGHWVLICNDTITGRHLLTAYLSDDEGATWKWSRAIEEAEFEAGNFSYPAVIQSADDTVHVTYSYKRKGVEGSTIKHVAFTENWIKGGD